MFFLDPCNLDIINRKIKSIALCVSKCPATELKTYNELKQFALNNGEKYFTSENVSEGKNGPVYDMCVAVY